MTRAAALALSLALLAACSEPSGEGTSSVAARTEGGQCPGTPADAGAAGALCNRYSECSEVCCTCSKAPSKGFAGAACVDGRCAAAAVACAKAEAGSSTVCQ